MTATERDPDPYARPLTYPGRPLATTGVLVDDAFRACEFGELDAVLEGFHVPTRAERIAMVAVGCNASIAWIRRKFRDSAEPLVVPMAPVLAHGLVPGTSAHVSRPGYVPATPVAVGGQAARLCVLWLTATQALEMDATEPNYDRVVVAPDRYRLVVESDGHTRLTDPCSVYTSRHGCLADAGGEPLRMTSQPALITGLLAGFPDLRALAGPDPESFVTAMRDVRKREAARELFITAGRVLRPAV